MPKKSVASTALDPTIQFATLTIDGELYKLVYSFNAIAKAEGVTGCNLLNGLLSLESLSAVHLIGLLYAALSVAHPDMTVEKAGELVRLDTISSITQALAEAYALSMPQKKTA
jgi:hypothetical protein